MKKVIAIILVTVLFMLAAAICVAAQTYLRGDADDDGEVTILDATYIQRFEANITLPSPLNMKSANVDDDEGVTIIDATLIQRWLAGIANPCGIGDTVVETVQPTKDPYELPFIPK